MQLHRLQPLVPRAYALAPARVLVALQLTEADQETLRLARELASRGAKVALCHAVADDDLAHADDLGEAIADRHWAVHSQARTLTGGADIEIFLDVGEPHDVVSRYAAEWRAQQVLIGHVPTEGLFRHVTGGIAKVVRHSPCSVVIARPRRDGGHIVIGTDLSEASRPAMRAAAAEQVRTGATATLVHCVEPAFAAGPTGIEGAVPPIDPAELDDQLTVDLLAEASSVGLRATPLVLHAPAARGLIDVATDTEADLLILATAGRTGIRRLLLGSVAEAVASDAPCTVLVARS